MVCRCAPLFVLVLVVLLVLATTPASAFLDQLLGGLMGGGGDERCEFRCARGRLTLPNPTHRKTANGCGVSGLKLPVDEFPGFLECCNEHDFCYDECHVATKKDKSDCDDEFGGCLRAACDKPAAFATDAKRNECRQQATLFTSGTQAFGCGAYQQSQKNACRCVPDSGDAAREWLAREDVDDEQRRRSKLTRKPSGGIGRAAVGRRPRTEKKRVEL